MGHRAFIVSNSSGFFIYNLLVSRSDFLGSPKNLARQREFNCATRTRTHLSDGNIDRYFPCIFARKIAASRRCRDSKIPRSRFVLMKLQLFVSVLDELPRI